MDQLKYERLLRALVRVLPDDMLATLMKAGAEMTSATAMESARPLARVDAAAITTEV